MYDKLISMMKRFWLILITICVLQVGCELPQEIRVDFGFNPISSPDSSLLVIEVLIPEKESPTPFQPVENTATFTPSSTGTVTLTQTSTETLTPTLSLTPTWTEIYTTTATSSFTPTILNTSTLPQYPARTRTPTISRTPTQTRTITRTGTATRSPTATSTASITSTWTSSNVYNWTSTPSFTATVTSRYTATVTGTGTSSTTATPSSTFTPLESWTPSMTWTTTQTSPASATPTSSSTSTTTSTQTSTNIPTNTPVNTNTRTPTASFTPVPGCSPGYGPSLEDQVVGLINQERINNGLPALTVRSQLTAAARGHSQDMACNGFFSHTGSDGSTARDRIARQGYSTTWVGENIYGGTMSSPSVVVTWWMNSAPHRANILNTNYTSIGIGYVYVSTALYQKYWTANFARP